MLARFGGWCFRHPWQVVGGWVLAAVVIFGTVGAIGSGFNGKFEIPASESRDGLDVLEQYFQGMGDGQSASIVFRADQGVNDPAVRQAMEAMFAQVAAIDGVTLESPYAGPRAASQVSADGHVAYAALTVSLDINQTEAAAIGEEIAGMIPQIDGLQVEIGGAVLGSFQPPQSELIGLSFAVVVLILAFGSVMAMGLPIAVAVSGVGLGMGTITLLSHVFSMPDFATTLGAMIGLGVGIDYALIIVTRYREGLAAGRSTDASVMTAMDTAGRSVIFAGITVVISLLGMLLMGLPFISGMGISAAATVLVTMVASITLLPALLGFARERLEISSWSAVIAAGVISVGLLGMGLGHRPFVVAFPVAVVLLIAGRWLPGLRAHVPHRAPRPIQETVPYKWSRLVQAHPWIALMAGAVFLLTLAAPVVTLRMGFSDEGNYRPETTTRRAYDLLAQGFGPGFNGPLIVTAVVHDAADRAAVEGLAAALGSAEGVASVAPPFPNDLADPSQAQAYLIQVIPTTSPQDQATFDLVDRLRKTVIPQAVSGTSLAVSVTGAVATNIDFTNYLTDRLLVFFGAVLALSFLLLMTVFRSVLVPLKAVVMNVLSIGAAYGVVVAIFQWGWGGKLLGIAGAPVEPFIPMMMFAIVFGLSMDYEVFLLSRVREEYDRSGDARRSVADGLASTAHVISAAAAIMVVVFGSFMFEDNRIVKLFGIGLGAAVLLDATVVRMLLVPATMELLGEKNWWMPGWLGRVLPVLHVEGATLDLEPVPVRDDVAGGS